MIMTKEELSTIIEYHQHWLNRDCEGWERMKANLREVDLTDVNLTYANLRYADLENADLRYSILNGADLRGANLKNADLKGASLIKTFLAEADLGYAELVDANLTNADLRGANLTAANLVRANLADAYLEDANLEDILGDCANFTSATGINNSRIGEVLTTDLIGYKKCENEIIVKLLIPRGAIVFSINNKKCRTNKAKVLEIEGADRAYSLYGSMSYYVGDEITVYDFDCQYNLECTKGIHFFKVREDAIGF